MSKEKKELTLEERMVYGECPWCEAKHGEPCKRKGDVCLPRLANAPKYVEVEEKDSEQKE